MSWATKRQFFYFLMSFLIISGIGGLFAIKFTAPTCGDGKQNQNEEGIDCGGICPNACLGEIKDLSIIWARPLKVDNGNYDAIALIDNSNFSLRSDMVKYQFKLYDKNNVLVAVKSGQTLVPPGQKFAIFESNINTGRRSPNKAFIEFEKNIDWYLNKDEKISIVVVGKEYDDDPFPALSVVLSNKSIQDVKGVRVTAIVYDFDGNAMAASATRLDEIKATSEKKVYFTWPVDFDEEVDSTEILIFTEPSELNP